MASMAGGANNSRTTATGKVTFMKNILLGSHLPPFSRGMLRNTQFYCLTTLILGILCVVWSIVHYDSAYYGSLFTLPNVAVMNIMACRVYRNTKLDGVQGTQLPCVAMAQIQFEINQKSSELTMDLEHSQGRAKH
ncbi:hypothetical protein CC1G_07352 [Coprinopsis cinerea okayama7|uniref:Uncharacterized protein n=1 Tax=Coprinopsis cinerea (strain Okayama-7 / 130 / ATCC MYA-4618 / FGSC 9003) TaxID=240176 RepID=A8N6I1_COPC7|nr:hypothetical protein CC1G_07352 [Coprinopsis cinerea okayama7\|eukprot:XP_001830437.1 hypothetical protein CC1G_07352 [Coprinopsis cinerea okayama7\